VTRRFALLVNPSAAGGRTLRALPDIRSELGRLGAEHRVVETRDLDHARTEARAAAEDGETVAPLGGDGFVGPVAGVLRGADSALAILPGGRGNDFARVLGIPFEPRAAARTAVEGRERRVDMAVVGDRPFIGIASLGFDSDANRIANEARLVRGNLVYLYAALRALAAWRDATFEVEVDGRREVMTGYSVAVANSKAYGGGMYLVPHAEVDDGVLDVFMCGRTSKLRALRDLPKVFKGTHVDSPWISFLRGAVVSVSADRPFVVYADGDPIGELPITVRVEPRCLRVIVPADPAAEPGRS
jgi:YegS/Rv2252/BmrU family lipid kinase